jgi:hypothetical protein
MSQLAAASPWTTVRFRRAKDIKAWALLGIPLPLYPIVVQRLFERQARFLAKYHRGRYVSLLFEAPADLAAVLATTFAAPPGCDALSVNEAGDRILFGKAAQSGRAKRQISDDTPPAEEDEDLGVAYGLAELSQFNMPVDESPISSLPVGVQLSHPLAEPPPDRPEDIAPTSLPVAALPSPVVDPIEDEAGWVEEDVENNSAELTDVWAMAEVAEGVELAADVVIPSARSFPRSVPLLSFDLTLGELDASSDESYQVPIEAVAPEPLLPEPLLPAMEAPNHVAVLKQGVEAWNSWRRQYPDVRPSLRGAYLNGLPLCRLDLRDTDLRFAFLFRADLRGADLRGAVLIGADLIQANLRSADLRGANLSGAYLSQANLDHANLRGADLRGTFLQGAFFFETVMPSGRSSGEAAIAEDAVVRQAG